MQFVFFLQSLSYNKMPVITIETKTWIKRSIPIKIGKLAVSSLCLDIKLSEGISVPVISRFPYIFYAGDSRTGFCISRRREYKFLYFDQYSCTYVYSLRMYALIYFMLIPFRSLRFTQNASIVGKAWVNNEGTKKEPHHCTTFFIGLISCNSLGRYTTA